MVLRVNTSRSRPTARSASVLLYVVVVDDRFRFLFMLLLLIASGSSLCHHKLFFNPLSNAFFSFCIIIITILTLYIFGEGVGEWVVGGCPWAV